MRWWIGRYCTEALASMEEPQKEEKLLIACTGKREHIRPIIICALDTGMRKGEILKLVPSDVDLENRVINVRAFNTKNMRGRQVAMTERLACELQVLIEKLVHNPEVLLFGILDDFKKAFIAARKAAGLTDVRFHDLRHTHATRLGSVDISTKPNKGTDKTQKA